MSGLKKFFSKSANTREEQTLKFDPRTQSKHHVGSEDEEDMYEALDPDQEGPITSSQGHDADEADEWSEDEFEEEEDVEEDIYCNDSELTRALAPPLGCTQVVQNEPEVPVLPPRSRGPQPKNIPQAEQQPSLPSMSHGTTLKTSKSLPAQRCSPVPPALSGHKKFKGVEVSDDSDQDSYEEIPREISLASKLKAALSMQQFQQIGDDPQSDEDYEAVDAACEPTVAKSSRVQPTSQRSLPELPQPPVPSLPSRSNRPCPPLPSVMPPEEMYVAKESEPQKSSSSGGGGGLMNMMASMFKQNTPKVSNLVPSTPLDEEDTYDVEDSPPASSRPAKKFPNSLSRPLPEVPPNDEGDESETDEVAQGPMSVPHTGGTSGKTPANERKTSLPSSELPLKSRRAPPVPQGEESLSDASKPSSNKFPPKTSPLPMRAGPKTPESEDERKGNREPSPDDKNKGAHERSQPKMSGIESCLAANRPRQVPYTPVQPKGKETTVSSIKTSKSIYPRHILPKLTLQKPESEDAAASIPSTNSNSRPKGNYPKHIPPKMQPQQFDIPPGQKFEKPSEPEVKESSFLVNARSALKTLKDGTPENSGDSRPKKTQGVGSNRRNFLPHAPPSPAPEATESRSGDRKSPAVAPKPDVPRKPTKCSADSSTAQIRAGNDSASPNANTKPGVFRLRSIFEEKIASDKEERVCSPSAAGSNSKAPSLIERRKSSSAEVKEANGSVQRDLKEDLAQALRKRQNFKPQVKDRVKDPVFGGGSKRKSEARTPENDASGRSDESPTQVVPSRAADVSNQKVMAPDSFGDCPWYHPDVTRAEAEKKLKSMGKDGSFLIRNSQRGASLTPYSLSLFQSEKVFNLQVRRRSDGMFAIGSEKPDEQSFKDIREMVSYYSTTQIEIMGGTKDRAFLLHPAKK